MWRVYTYEEAARVAGVGQISPNPNNVPPPFSGSYGYDAFNNLSSRSGQYALNPSQSDSATYTNNRRIGTGWSYDPEGRVPASANHTPTTSLNSPAHPAAPE